MTSVINARPASYLELVEDAIVTALKAGVEGSVKVENFPADVKTYDFTGLKAAALVHYKGSKFSERNGPVNPNQGRRMNFAIVLLARVLRGHGGAYHALEDIRLALQGNAFQGAGPAEIVSDGLISEHQGQWRWEIVIGLNAPAVARVRQQPAPLLNPVTQTAPIPGRDGNV
jgi:hypothetical protein